MDLGERVSRFRPMTGRILLAGLAGGLAEILWVTLVGSFLPVDGSEVARQVTATVFPALAPQSYAPALGVGIHLALSLVLAAGFVLVPWAPFVHDRGSGATLLGAVLALAAVWAINFFVILPALNPAFVRLMPYAVTLVSKLLFGVAMAGALLGTARAALVRPKKGLTPEVVCARLE